MDVDYITQGCRLHYLGMQATLLGDVGNVDSITRECRSTLLGDVDLIIKGCRLH